MVLRLNSQVLENRLRPESFHRVPVLNLPMPDRIVEFILRTIRCSQSFIPNGIIQVLRTTLHGQVGACPTATSSTTQVRGLVRNRRSTCTSSRTRFIGNCRREDERGGVVAGETCGGGGSTWSVTRAPLPQAPYHNRAQEQ